MTKKLFFSFIVFFMFINISLAYVINADFETGDFTSLTGENTNSA